MFMLLCPFFVSIYGKDKGGYGYEGNKSPFIIPDSSVVALDEQPVTHEPLLAIKTNMLYDLATAPNIGLEFYPRNSRWTISADYTFSWWSRESKHICSQLIDGSLDFRCYLGKKIVQTGHYLSVYGHANLYDFCIDAERGWQGEGWGLGLGYGYVWKPWKNKRWKLEAFIRMGYYQSVYDPYHAGEEGNDKYYYDWEGKVEDFKRRNHRLRWYGPTGVGITLRYDLFNRTIRSDK